MVRISTRLSVANRECPRIGSKPTIKAPLVMERFRFVYAEPRRRAGPASRRPAERSGGEGLALLALWPLATRVRGARQQVLTNAAGLVWLRPGWIVRHIATYREVRISPSK
jgi:hypothetical protein